MNEQTNAPDVDYWAQCTEREQRYIDHYAATGKKRDSAIAAGFSEKAASNAAYRLSKRPRVSKAIIQRRDKLNGDTSTAAEDIRRELWLNHRKAQDKGNIAASNRALELLGKANGMFSDRLEVTGKDGEPLATRDLSDAELARRLGMVFKRGERQAIETPTPEDRKPPTH